jgi:hypothetical protein
VANIAPPPFVPASPVLRLEETLERLASLRDGTFERDYPRESVGDVYASAVKQLEAWADHTCGRGWFGGEIGDDDEDDDA